MSKRFRIDRRTVLRGMGGVAVALPALELMGRPDGWGPSRAYAQTGPKRFLVSYAGVSVGADRLERDALTPNNEGFGYDLREATQILATLGVHNEVSLVSGLEVPKDGSPGSVADNSILHYRVLGSTLAGTTCSSNQRPQGPTVAEVAADALAGDGSHRILDYVVQQNVESAINWRWTGSSPRKIDGFSNPRLAYEDLFGGFTFPDPNAPTGGTTPPPTGITDITLRSRRSVLDLVSQSTERLMRRVGTADRVRLEQHFDEIRALETRLAALSGEGGAPTSGPTGSGCGEFDVSGGTIREIAEAFGRLVVMSWACDTSRVTALSMTESKCYMDASTFSEFSGQVHGGTHSAGRNEGRLHASLSFFIEQFGFIAKLAAETPDVDGSSLLDNAAMTHFFEGGHGRSGGTTVSHSTENMVMLVAGRSGGLVPGQHIRGNNRHPARVMVSALQAVGLETNRLNEVEGNIPELFQTPA